MPPSTTPPSASALSIASRPRESRSAVAAAMLAEPAAMQHLSPQAEVLATTPQVLGTEQQLLGTEAPTQLGKLVVLRPPTLASASVLISNTTSLVQRKAVPGRSGLGGRVELGDYSILR